LWCINFDRIKYNYNVALQYILIKNIKNTLFYCIKFHNIIIVQKKKKKKKNTVKKGTYDILKLIKT